MKQPVARRAKNFWRAIVSRSGSGVAGGVPVNREIGIVQHHQVKPAIPIIVKEGSARAPAFIVGARLLRDINKGPVALVQIHLVMTEISNVEIGQSIIVNVADCRAHSVPSGHDAALFSHVGELECPGAIFRDQQIIPEQPASR